jgi:seryl-tRNA(Sec) selenium transferase
MSYINKTVTTDIPFWQMATTPTEALQLRGEKIVATLHQQFGLSAQLVPTQAMPGAGSTPGAFINSFAVSLNGNHVPQLRKHRIPVIARTENGQTLLDLRSFDARDDNEVALALSLVK